MDLDTALSFLRDNPSISHNSPQAVIDTLEEVREFLEVNPDPQCIAPLLAVFGDHMGWGIFQLFDSVLAQFSTDDLAPHLNVALRSKYRGVRWWATHWAMQFPAPLLTEELLVIIDRAEDSDAHYFAIAALGDIYEMTQDLRIRTALKHRQAIEASREVVELLDECLKDLS